MLFAVSCRVKNAPENTPITGVDSSLHREWKTENKVLLANAIPLLQTGDIVLRTGADATSHALRSMNQKNRKFSHCGIVVMEDGKPWIYHSIGGEDNPDAHLLRETPEVFFSPIANSGGGVCRYALSEEVKSRVVQIAQQWFREGRTFDMAFDLATDTQLYCAEFVYKAFLKGGINPTYFSTSHTGGFEYVAVDDLYSHPAAKIICSFEYK